MNGVKADMLIDTGATTSMISTELYSKISVQDKPSLEHMVAVNSTPLKVKGSGEFDMNVEGVSFPATFIVAEINIPIYDWILFPSITAKSR